MTMMNGSQYVQSIKKMRPNVYKFGKLIEDVTEHPETQGTIKLVAASYDHSFDEKHEALFTTKSHLSGNKIHRWNSLMQSEADTIANSRMKRIQFHESGTCTGSTCAGWTSLNSLWAVTYEVDQDLGTNYHQRLKKYFQYVEDNALALAGAITDAKGNRSQKPSMQKHLDANLHVKEVRPDGIVIRGYKAQICGVVGAHEIICVPGNGYGEADKDFAVAVAVPRDSEGLTVVQARNPNDTRETEAGWDAPHAGNCAASFLLFDDVFVPNERVFMCREYKHSGKFINFFTALYRSAIGGCVSGHGDIIVGTAINMARANGLSEKVFQDKLTKMAINNEIVFGLGVGAMALGAQHPSGLWVPNSLLAHVNKTLVASLPYETKMHAHDICGGIVETGCFPSCTDMQSSLYGEKLQQALTAGSDGVARAKLARLMEWLTFGGAGLAFIHGGGSPDGAKLVVKAQTPWEEYAAEARRIAKIEE